MNKIIALVGRSAVGKTTLEKMLESNYKYVPLISHTSRPKRDGEIDGKEYYFTDNENIYRIINNNETLENVEYIVNGEEWNYVLTKKEIENKMKLGRRMVVTVNPHGVNQIIEHDYLLDNLIVVYMTAKDNLQFRYYAREKESLETAKKWKQRKYQDDIDFSLFENEIIPKMIEKGVKVLEYDNTLNDEPTMSVEDLNRFVSILDDFISK